MTDLKSNARGMHNTLRLSDTAVETLSTHQYQFIDSEELASRWTVPESSVSWPFLAPEHTLLFALLHTEASVDLRFRAGAQRKATDAKSVLGGFCDGIMRQDRANRPMATQTSTHSTATKSPVKKASLPPSWVGRVPQLKPGH